MQERVRCSMRQVFSRLRRRQLIAWDTRDSRRKRDDQTRDAQKIDVQRSQHYSRSIRRILDRSDMRNRAVKCRTTRTARGRVTHEVAYKPDAAG